MTARGGVLAHRLLLTLALAATGALTGAAASGPMTSHTATGWHLELGYAGDAVVLPDGEHLRNQVQIWRVDSADARLAGRRTLILTDGARQPDGTTRLFGTWTGEPGSWAGSTFTPAGGYGKGVGAAHAWRRGV